MAIWPKTFPYLADIWPADSDNELRFYSVFWFAYGACLIFVSRDVIANAKQISWLLTLFFIGGVGRAISIVQVGFPSPLFVVLMAIELTLPLLVFFGLRLLVHSNEVHQKSIAE